MNTRKNQLSTSKTTAGFKTKTRVRAGGDGGGDEMGAVNHNATKAGFKTKTRVRAGGDGGGDEMGAVNHNALAVL